MGKKKPKRKIQRNDPVIQPITIKENSRKKYIIKIGKVIVGIGVVVGILSQVDEVRNLFRSQHEKYEKETFEEGDLKPEKIAMDTVPYYRVLETPPIFTKARNNTFPKIKGILIKNIQESPILLITIGNYLSGMPIDLLYKGLEFGLPSKDSSCGELKIAFGLKDDRLYVSTEFKDLKKEETIGVIEFNHWKLYKANMFDYKNDDDRLEVLDIQNNIVFSILYKVENGKNIINVSGYFINPVSALVIQNNTPKRKTDIMCFPKADSNWKIKALNEIVKIKSIF